MLAFRRTTRSGITLLELLIVMVIMLMVTAAAIPLVVPATRNRQMREGTRLVTAYFGAARARAVQTGRPAGVLIERFEPSALNGGAFAMQMSQVEIPAPYSGDVVGAQAVVAITSPGATAGQTPNTAQSLTTFNTKFNDPNTSMGAVWFTAAIDTSTFNTQLVRVGDQIKFGNHGHVFTIYGPDVAPADGVIDNPGGTVTLDIAYQYPASTPYVRANAATTPFIANVRFPWENTAPLPVPQPTTYQVFRQPVRTITPPLVLPEGIVVDLSVSGVGSTLYNTRYYSGTNIGTAPAGPPIVRADPVVIFSPSGRLDWVSNPDGQLVRPTDSVYLLMGRRELMYDATVSVPAQAKDIVFQNLSPVPNPATTAVPPAQNYWVTIGYQTGQVTTAEVAPHFQDYTATVNGASNLQQVIDFTLNGNGSTYLGARDFARESQSIAGR